MFMCKSVASVSCVSVLRVYVYLFMWVLHARARVFILGVSLCVNSSMCVRASLYE